MRRTELFLFTALVAFVLFVACQKEKDEGQKKESSLRFTNAKPSSSDVNEKPFTIANAGVFDKYLYLGLTYSGGMVGHEFIVTWDGVVKNVETKKFIDLKVYHVNTTDNGTDIISDSLMLDMTNLKISNELRTDKNLYFNVVNTSNLANVIVVPAVYYSGNENDGIPTIINPNLFENIDVQVVSQADCSKGVFGSLWLKNSNNETFYLPKAVENNISYTPTLNDRLKISFERTWFSDSTTNCSSWTGKQFEVINIKTLVKIQ